MSFLKRFGESKFSSVKNSQVQIENKMNEREKERRSFLRKTFFKVSAQTFRHYFTWYHWLIIITITIITIIIIIIIMIITIIIIIVIIIIMIVIIIAIVIVIMIIQLQSA